MGVLAINGGQKTLDHKWPDWPIWDDRERLALDEVLDSGKWWYGEKVAEFESKFAGFQNAAYGVVAATGTAAIEASLLALGVGAGDEVIVPPYTFMATASAVLRVNAIPVFADILPDTLCIDPDDVLAKITDKTRAIIPVHMAGYISDMDRLNEIAAERGLYILEDACHAWGSQWKGKGAGALGDLGAFSFQASKNITSGEGGIILTDDESLADACRSFTNCGRGKDKPWYEHYLLGSNLRLTEFQAAILLAQLTRLEEQTLTRQSNAKILDDGLREIPGVILLKDDPRITRRSYHMYAFRVDQEVLGISRGRFAEAVSAEGAPTWAGYTTPLYKNPLFQRTGDGPNYCPVSCPYYGRPVDYSTVCCPICEQVCEDTCWIGHPALLAAEEAMHLFVAAVRKVCDNLAELR